MMSPSSSYLYALVPNIGLLWVSHQSFRVSLSFVIKTFLFGLIQVSFGSRTRRDQNKTKKVPNKIVETTIRPKEDSFETKRRPNCDY
jgi:hypothetical protein